MEVDTLLCLPRYFTMVDDRHTLAVSNCGRPCYLCKTRGSSVLQNCNSGWAMALDLFEQGKCRWFAMLHSDVWAEDNWLQSLICSAEEFGAVMMGTVIPIKDNSGDCSLALETDDIWRPHRLSMGEVRKKEGVWTDDRLLLNTGCFVVDLACPEIRKQHFRFENTILMNDKKQRVPITIAEDWVFSRDARRSKVDAIYCNNKIKTIHLDGGSGYAWG